ncbi:GntR family transcriptional regulator [Verminephrobacter aporrectodeae]|uniref:GntR family transcriptional regulator n=1 Tax=Verminephrobacter aporrectodeae TaxID=1110389 RepID=UPI00223775A4|nr:GntR family transcriptional regulator [Verminephrobacter aporrectodeae]MCW5221069.1 GntR family transcriptional regulator [Verminephrobacter aporrectodeae subsp. tuberculatae]MCW5290362.1 GntR family transcriptional regulator [Verminephrobacter aporrectodeae subsp. tuberculatae]MCW8175933.1 GntR family transcriptional regulator [Verminephrobacter aporrectodeae subsp. tuberculatae]MCW8203632.1 GntR family transcriptional regulator [Verminephrobacter aporrectodeae subsp. tuberculatae]
MREAAKDSVVHLVHGQLRSMAIGYEFKPGERLNEGELAKRLGVSRTPLREALHRLNTEGLLHFVPGKGFFCRDLDVHEIFSLYEVRKAIEVAAIRLAIGRAKDQDIDDLLGFLGSTGPAPGNRSTDELVELDETFHERLIALSGNPEMLRVLRNLNARIHLVRWIDMERCDRTLTQTEHLSALQALKARNDTACVAILEKHIDRRLDQITSALRAGYAQIYMPQT